MSLAARYLSLTQNKLRAEVEIDLAPLVREELESKLMTTKVDRTMGREVLRAIKSDGKVKVTDEVAEFILKQLQDSIRAITKDKWLSQEPTMKYHLGALEYAVKELRPLSATLLALIADASKRARLGLTSQEEVASLVNAVAHVVEAKGCPEQGCIVQRQGKWRVVSNKTGKLWPQTYDTQQNAEGALAAYHMRQQGVPPR
jgi:hypothetical protein